MKKKKIEPGSLEEFLGDQIVRYSEEKLAIMRAGWFIGSNHGTFTKKMPTEDELYCLKWSYEMGCRKAMERNKPKGEIQAVSISGDKVQDIKPQIFKVRSANEIIE